MEKNICAIDHMTSLILLRTHIYKSHDPESIWHPGDDNPLCVHHIVGGVG